MEPTQNRKDGSGSCGGTSKSLIEKHKAMTSIAYLFLDGREVASIKMLSSGGLAMVLCRSDGFRSLARIAQSSVIHMSRDGETITEVPKEVFEQEYGKDLQAVYLNQGIYLERELDKY